MHHPSRAQLAPHVHTPSESKLADRRPIASMQPTTSAAAVLTAPSREPRSSPLETHAGRAAELMRQLGNDRRILLLCCLIDEGEVTVGKLAQHVGLSMSAVSQHLKVLRWDGLVSARRQGAEIYYRIADARVVRLIALLQDVFAEDRSA